MTKTCLRWTPELDKAFVESINNLGGSESEFFSLFAMLTFFLSITHIVIYSYVCAEITKVDGLNIMSKAISMFRCSYNKLFPPDTFRFLS